MRPAALLLPFLLLAGCVGLAPADVEPAAADPLAAVRALLADVPCEADVGEGTSENLLPLSLTPLPESDHAELDGQGPYLLAARHSAGGFGVLDPSDPAAPALVGTYLSEGTRALDVKWLPLGDAAVVGVDEGVELVDLRDPAQPVLLSTWRFADAGLPFTEAHMVDAHLVGGKEWVFVAPASDSGVYVLERVGDALEYRASYQHPLLKGGPIGPHDMTVLDDELLGKPVLYVANGFEGWLAADVSDPASPKHLGGMVNADPAQGYLHTIQAEKVGDRRLVATVSEVGVNAVKVWDATDLARPVLLAEWFSDPARPVLPNHNLQLLHGMLYVAHYGQGVYVFDLATRGATPYAGTLEMRPVARFVPEGATQAANPALAFVDVWDVVVVDGVLYASDQEDGVHAVGFGCLAPGDAAQRSRG